MWEQVGDEPCLVCVVGVENVCVDVCELVSLSGDSGLEFQVAALLVGEDGVDFLGGPADVWAEHDTVGGVTAKVWHLVLAAASK